MKLLPLKIGELVAAVPIIQGGMGVGVSRSRLAAAVANEGGIGIISGAQIGFEEADFETNANEANMRALGNEIRKAKEASPNGIIGVNLMVAMNNYKEAVNTAVKAGVDLIISGAGLPTELPSLVKGLKTKIAPIVSSGKAAAVIAKMWDRKHSCAPDLVVVEGPEAGGHLGFSLDQLQTENKPELLDIVKEVIDALKPYEEKYNRSIPVIAAGGIFTGEDIAKCIKAGAAGVQMATRFVATEECDADIRYKMTYVDSKKEDIGIVKSPVGMPGRAIYNKFLKRLEEGRIPVKKCYDCLKPCEPANTPYCITKALIEAVKGNVDEGLIFTGSNAYRIEKIVTVKELMQQLVSEAELCLI
jgi:NAD(P)H-dependent flavin oxidoreductase YrpB (nitropropane dioxygenase family)